LPAIDAVGTPDLATRAHDVGADPNRNERRRSLPRTARATWELVAIIVVLGAILVLAADGAGLISR
jgi:hypothetical protein